MNLTLAKVIPEGNQKCPKSKISLFYKSKSPPRKRFWWKSSFLKFCGSRDWSDPKIPSQSDTQPDGSSIRTCFNIISWQVSKFDLFDQNYYFSHNKTRVVSVQDTNFRLKCHFCKNQPRKSVDFHHEKFHNSNISRIVKPICTS